MAVSAPSVLLLEMTQKPAAGRAHADDDGAVPRAGAHAGRHRVRARPRRCRRGHRPSSSSSPRACSPACSPSPPGTVEEGDDLLHMSPRAAAAFSPRQDGRPAALAPLALACLSSRSALLVCGQVPGRARRARRGHSARPHRQHRRRNVRHAGQPGRAAEAARAIRS